MSIEEIEMYWNNSPPFFLKPHLTTDIMIFSPLMYDPNTFLPIRVIFDNQFNDDIREKIKINPEKMLQYFLNFMIEEFNFDGDCQLKFLSEKL